MIVLILKQRTLKVLISVVERYIQTGEPVGSKTVCEMLVNPPSSSTIRNEMASLTALGLLEQPHISAGRIPTINGYKLYVNNISYKSLSKSEQDYIYGMFTGMSLDPESILKESCNILSKITNCMVVYAPPPVGESFVKEIRFIKISTHTSMLILITSSGMVQNQLFNCEFEINDEVLYAFTNSVNKKFKNQKLKVLFADMQKIIFSKEEKDIIITSAFRAAFSAISKICENHVGIAGKQNLFHFQSVSRSFDILNFIEDKKFSEFIFSSSSKIKIYIGDNSYIDSLSDCAVIVEKYNAGENVGAITIVGPIRINYNDVISKLDYIVYILQNMFSVILNY